MGAVIAILKERPSQSVVSGITLVALVATLAFFITMRADEAAMQAAGDYGIVDYELAFTAERADEILMAWGMEGQSAARNQLWLDYGFMSSYGLLFAGLVLMIARGLRGTIQNVGLTLTIVPIVAAVLDAIENAMLLIMLNGAAPGPALVAGVCATIKFLLLTIVMLFWSVGGIAWLASGRRR